MSPLVAHMGGLDEIVSFLIPVALFALFKAFRAARRRRSERTPRS